MDIKFKSTESVLPAYIKLDSYCEQDNKTIDLEENQCKKRKISSITILKNPSIDSFIIKNEVEPLHIYSINKTEFLANIQKEKYIFNKSCKYSNIVSPGIISDEFYAYVINYLLEFKKNFFFQVISEESKEIFFDNIFTGIIVELSIKKIKDTKDLFFMLGDKLISILKNTAYLENFNELTKNYIKVNNILNIKEFELQKLIDFNDKIYKKRNGLSINTSNFDIYIDKVKSLEKNDVEYIDLDDFDELISNFNYYNELAITIISVIIQDVTNDDIELIKKYRKHIGEQKFNFLVIYCKKYIKSFDKIDKIDIDLISWIQN